MNEEPLLNINITDKYMISLIKKLELSISRVGTEAQKSWGSGLVLL